MTAGKFIFGIIITAIGFLIVWKTEWLMQNFGRIGFAEDKLRTMGGSRLAYRVIGTIIIIYGLIYATDLSDDLIQWLVETIFNSNKQK